MKNFKKLILALVLTLGFFNQVPDALASEIVYYKDYDLDEVLGLKETINENPIEEEVEGKEESREKAPEAYEDTYVKGEVINVVDGGTYDVEVSGQVHRVRAIGVNTPETKHPQKEVEYYGVEASNFAKENLEGSVVYLEKDISDIDRYGMYLRYVWISLPSNLNNPSFDDVKYKSFNGILVRDGFANAATYAPDIKYADYFYKIEEEAIKNTRGMWNEEGLESFKTNTSNINEDPDDDHMNIPKPNVDPSSSYKLEESHEEAASDEGDIYDLPNYDKKFKYPRGDKPTDGQVREYITNRGTTYKADRTRGVIKGNRASGIYHIDGQSHYDKISVKNVTWFYSIEEAISKGYRSAKK